MIVHRRHSDLVHLLAVCNGHRLGFTLIDEARETSCCVVLDSAVKFRQR